MLDKYFRAIGYTQMKNQEQFNEMVQKAFEDCDKKVVNGTNEEEITVECYQNLGEGFGIMIYGTIDQKEQITITKCFPYVESKPVLSVVYPELETTVQNNQILYFYEKKSMNQFACRLQKNIESQETIQKLTIGILSVRGKVLLPVYQPEEACEQRKAMEKEQRKLIVKAQKGDAAAEQALYESFHKTTNILHERLQTEDFFSVVEGYSEPIEESLYSYSFLGTIEKAKKLQNKETGQWIHKLLVNITGTKVNVFISVDDLIGEPLIGMRFWGSGIFHGNALSE